MTHEIPSKAEPCPCCPWRGKGPCPNCAGLGVIDVPDREAMASRPDLLEVLAAWLTQQKQDLEDQMDLAEHLMSVAMDLDDESDGSG
ncbi:MAG: hypothetical protein WCJ30_03130 [Deltaproteobacteria bacterium]